MSVDRSAGVPASGFCNGGLIWCFLDGESFFFLLVQSVDLPSYPCDLILCTRRPCPTCHIMLTRLSTS
jgi:hypothetical protein